MKTKFKKLKAIGIIECWKAFCVHMVDEQGWKLKDMYKYYERELHLYNEQDELIDKITYDDFTQITKSVFYKITQYLILGEPYHLENGNGHLKARRIEGEIEEKKWSKQGLTEQKEYWGLEDWCVINWNKPPIGLFENKSYLNMQKFTIARDNNGTGLKQRFNNAIKQNPSLMYGFDFLPSNSMF